MEYKNAGPLVSVVIAAYNCEKYIDICMDSLFNQTYKNIQIVICNDSSTDDTRKKLEKYEHLDNVTIIENEHNMKQAYSRNRCIDLCSGEYIIIQDADDIAEPERIEHILNAFTEDIDFVGTNWYLFDDKGPYQNCSTNIEYPQKKDFLWGTPFCHATIMFRSEPLKRVKYDENISRGEDYNLLMELYAKGYRGKNIGEFLYGYRVDGNTLARRSLAARFEECKVRYNGFRKNGLLLPYGWIFTFKPIAAHIHQVINNYIYKNKYKTR